MKTTFNTINTPNILYVYMQYINIKHIACTLSTRPLYCDCKHFRPYMAFLKAKQQLQRSLQSLELLCWLEIILRNSKQWKHPETNILPETKLWCKRIKLQDSFSELGEPMHTLGAVDCKVLLASNVSKSAWACPCDYLKYIMCHGDDVYEFNSGITNTSNQFVSPFVRWSTISCSFFPSWVPLQQTSLSRYK